MGVLDIFKKAAGPLSRRFPKAADDDLFDDEFQRKLDYLAIVSRRVSTQPLCPAALRTRLQSSMGTG